MAAPILLVEDDADEIVLLRRALKLAGSSAPLCTVQDGAEAIEYLSRQGSYCDGMRYPLPRLMILDLQLPRVSGLGVLEWLRAQPGLRRLPVVVLTSSSEDHDVARAYDLGANSYLVKPAGTAELQRMAELLDLYWVGQNIRPSRVAG